MFSWLAVVVFLLVLVAVAAALTIRLRPGEHSGFGTGRAAGVRVTRVVAIAYAAASVIGTIDGALRSLFSESVTMSLPVRQFWPSLPGTVKIEGTTANVVAGGFDHALVAIEGLTAAARVWLAVGDVLLGMTNIVIGVVIALLCTSIIKQDPFRPALTRAITLTAVVIIVGGLGWQVCEAVAGGLASEQVLGAIGWSLDTEKVNWDDVRQIIGLPEVGTNWSVDFWPIWAGLALLTVSAVFHFGHKLQKDSEGLV